VSRSGGEERGSRSRRLRHDEDEDLEEAEEGRVQITCAITLKCLRGMTYEDVETIYRYVVPRDQVKGLAPSSPDSSMETMKVFVNGAALRSISEGTLAHTMGRMEHIPMSLPMNRQQSFDGQHSTQSSETSMNLGFVDPRLAPLEPSKTVQAAFSTSVPIVPLDKDGRITRPHDCVIQNLFGCFRKRIRKLTHKPQPHDVIDIEQFALAFAECAENLWLRQGSVCTRGKTDILGKLTYAFASLSSIADVKCTMLDVNASPTFQTGVLDDEKALKAAHKRLNVLRLRPAVIDFFVQRDGIDPAAWAIDNRILQSDVFQPASQFSKQNVLKFATSVKDCGALMYGGCLTDYAPEAKSISTYIQFGGDTGTLIKIADGIAMLCLTEVKSSEHVESGKFYKQTKHENSLSTQFCILAVPIVHGFHGRLDAGQLTRCLFAGTWVVTFYRRCSVLVSAAQHLTDTAHKLRASGGAACADEKGALIHALLHVAHEASGAGNPDPLYLHKAVNTSKHMLTGAVFGLGAPRTSVKVLGGSGPVRFSRPGPPSKRNQRTAFLDKQNRENMCCTLLEATNLQFDVITEELAGQGTCQMVQAEGKKASDSSLAARPLSVLRTKIRQQIDVVNDAAKTTFRQDQERLCILAQQEHAEDTVLSAAALSVMNVLELKGLCGRYGVVQRGTKDELVQRLCAKGIPAPPEKRKASTTGDVASPAPWVAGTDVGIRYTTESPPPPPPAPLSPALSPREHDDQTWQTLNMQHSVSHLNHP
jgi:hypothetical protein